LVPFHVQRPDGERSKSELTKRRGTDEHRQSFTRKSPQLCRAERSWATSSEAADSRLRSTRGMGSGMTAQATSGRSCSRTTYRLGVVCTPAASSCTIGGIFHGWSSAMVARSVNNDALLVTEGRRTGSLALHASLIYRVSRCYFPGSTTGPNKMANMTCLWTGMFGLFFPATHFATFSVEEAKRAD
jgi:hypothetical protein